MAAEWSQWELVPIAYYRDENGSEVMSTDGSVRVPYKIDISGSTHTCSNYSFSLYYSTKIALSGETMYRFKFDMPAYQSVTSKHDLGLALNYVNGTNDRWIENISGRFYEKNLVSLGVFNEKGVTYNDGRWSPGYSLETAGDEFVLNGSKDLDGYTYFVMSFQVGPMSDPMVYRYSAADIRIKVPYLGSGFEVSIDDEHPVLGEPIAIHIRPGYPALERSSCWIYYRTVAGTVYVGEFDRETIEYITLPESMGSIYPKGREVPITFIVETYYDGYQYTNKELDEIVYIPDYSLDDPTLNVSLVHTKEIMTSEEWPFGLVGYSSIAYLGNTSGKYGSTVRYRYEIYDGEEAIETDKNTYTPTEAKNYQISVTAIDSRNVSSRKITSSTIVNFQEYTPPVFVNLTAERCDSSGTASSTGTYVKVFCDVDINQLSFQSISYNEITDLHCDAIVNQPDTTDISNDIPLTNNVPKIIQYNHNNVITPFEEAKAYSITASVTDKFGITRTKTVIVSPAFITFHLAKGGMAAGFGRYIDPVTVRNKVQSSWPFESIAFHLLDEAGVPFAGHSLAPVVWTYDKKDPEAAGQSTYRTRIHIKTQGCYIFFGISDKPIMPAGQTAVTYANCGPDFRLRNSEGTPISPTTDYGISRFDCNIGSFSDINLANFGKNFGGMRTFGVAVLQTYNNQQNLDIDVQFGCWEGESGNTRRSDFLSEYSRIIGINVGDFIIDPREGL